MVQLTYADRERLLSGLDTRVENWSGTDAHLQDLAREWVERTTPSYGFEHALSRDVLQLCRYLQSNSTDSDISQISRGALLQVVSEPLSCASSTDHFSHLGNAFVCRYAVHEVRCRLGEDATFSFPRLTAEERSSAEALFLELVAEHGVDDVDLMSKVEEATDSLRTLTDSSLFLRFSRHISFLSNCLGDVGYTEEQRAYARGALAYFVCEEDAIDDRLGLVGLVDDCFIAQLAVDLISPTIEPWVDLLDEVAAAYPYMNNLLLEDGGCVLLPSEYQLINTALASRQVRGANSTNIVVVTPSLGPLPFLIGFSAALGLARTPALPDEQERFQVGQKVKVDYGSVAEFAGYCESADGRPMFKLRTYYQERGQKKLGRERTYSVSEISRLVPASSSLSARGQLPKSHPDPEDALPGLEYLFALDGKTISTQSAPRVMVIASAASCREYADRLAINGLSLRQVLPMGHLSTDAETIVRWTTRFGVTPPLLAFASDADAAYEYAANHDANFDLLVVDGTGRCVNQLASLGRLRQYSRSSVVFTDENNSEELIREGDSVWEWEEKDFASLVWPGANGSQHESMIARHERKLRQQAKTEPQIETIPTDKADAATNAYRDFLRVVRLRGDDNLFELDAIAAESFRLLSLQLRCAFVPEEDSGWTRAVMEHSQKIASLCKESAYLNADERSAIKVMEDAFASFGALIRDANPKAVRLQSILEHQPELTIVCPDTRLAVEVQSHNPKQEVVVMPTGDGEYNAGVVAPGWFRKARMVSLLSPPVADPLVLLLYSCEERWYSDFMKHRQNARRARRSGSDRSAVFPSVSGWAKPKPPEVRDPTAAVESRVEDAEQIEHSVTSQHFYHNHAAANTSEGVSARLVTFEDGSYGLFTDAYRLNVVTHLLDSPPDGEEEKDTVYLRQASQLKPGDAVVFGESGREIISTLADTLLHKNQRGVASLWRTALCEYARREGLSLARLTEQLRQAGCKVQQPTVNNWLKNDEIIGPQAYRRDVPVIAEVTGEEGLRLRQEEVIQAIAEIRSAHLKAPAMLARKVRRQARVLLTAGGLRSEEASDDGMELFQVADVDVQSHAVKRASTNRLMRGDAWLV